MSSGEDVKTAQLKIRATRQKLESKPFFGRGIFRARLDELQESRRFADRIAPSFLTMLARTRKASVDTAFDSLRILVDMMESNYACSLQSITHDFSAALLLVVSESVLMCVSNLATCDQVVAIGGRLLF